MAAIAFYGSRHFDDSFVTMYDSLDTKAGLTVDVSTENVADMVKPGTGVAYYLQPTSDGTNAPGLFSYPCYTLENDKTVNFYQANDYDRVLKTTNLKTVVAYVNRQGKANEINKLASQVTVDDQINHTKDGPSTQEKQARQNGTPVTSNNKITAHYLENSENALTKVAVYYGLMNGITPDWENLKAYVQKGGHIYFDEDGDQEERGLIFLDDGSNSGCALIFGAGNPASGSPDRYFFSHLGSDGTVVDFMENKDDVGAGNAGTSADAMVDFCNHHGGQRALAQVDVSGSY
ncbi:hypothetical protein [Lactiplantibacillus modestisalitolerans]|uniref:Uncharacterized protein n=1 Tax=Lactiplantibacillus modestisalitolerans TaxID=1457219 RepID=A0ABV5WV05_9LACO|nr:hypothetical protein [Lactiplantibacillus modestisalitolerans]